MIRHIAKYFNQFIMQYCMAGNSHWPVQILTGSPIYGYYFFILQHIVTSSPSAQLATLS